MFAVVEWEFLHLLLSTFPRISSHLIRFKMTVKNDGLNPSFEEPSCVGDFKGLIEAWNNISEDVSWLNKVHSSFEYTRLD